jgi:hypothetical protein
LISVFPFFIFFVFVDEGIVENSLAALDKVALLVFLFLLFLYAADDFRTSPTLRA